MVLVESTTPSIVAAVAARSFDLHPVVVVMSHYFWLLYCACVVR
jgi:hypothetical protein